MTATNETGTRGDEPSQTDESRDGGVSYWPLLRASIGSAAVAVSTQLVATMYFAVQHGISWRLGLWFGAIPRFVTSADRVVYDDIVFRSATFSSLVLIAYSLAAFVTRKRLQVQAGRAFAWVDIALIGIVNLVRVTWFDEFGTAATWMFALTLVGVVGFAVAITLVWIDYEDRAEAAGGPEVAVEGPEPVLASR